jgi:hypothetical protein
MRDLGQAIIALRKANGQRRMTKQELKSVKNAMAMKVGL